MKTTSNPGWMKKAIFGLTVLSMAILLAVEITGHLPAARGAESLLQAKLKTPIAYVGLFADNLVAVFDTRTNQVLAKISVPAAPHGLEATPDGKTVYVSSDSASVVSIIATATNTVTGSIEVGKGPHGLAITPDGAYLLVAGNGTDRVLKVATATNTVVGEVAVLKPHTIAITPDGKTAYVASQSDKPSLVVLDIAKMLQTGTVALDHVPRDASFTPDGKQLYFSQAGVDTVQVLNPATNEITARIPVGFSPHQPFFPPRSKLALVIVQGPNLLALIDLASEKVVGNVEVGKFPHWVATTLDGSTAFVTNEQGNSISIVDLATRKVTATLPIGNAPRKIIVVQPPSIDPANVSITNFAFTPSTVTIKVGDTVMWTNNDTVPHTISEDNGAWDSGNIDKDATFKHTFTTAGAYTYHCKIHPYMQGKIIVK